MIDIKTLSSHIDSMKLLNNAILEATIAALTESEMFNPMAIEEIQDGIRLISLDTETDQPRVRYVDAEIINEDNETKSSVTFISEWIPVNEEGGRYFFVDASGKKIDVTDIEYQTDLESFEINGGELKQVQDAPITNTPAPEVKPKENKPIKEEKGFRIWHVITEYGRNAESKGGDERKQNKIGILFAPVNIPNKQFINAIKKINHVSSAESIRPKNKPNQIVINVPDGDLRVFIIEWSSTGVVYPMSEYVDKVEESKQRHPGIKCMSVNVFMPILNTTIQNAVTP